MEKKLGKGTLDFDLQKDVWAFRQKYYEADNNESFFEELSKEAGELVYKYKDTPLSDFARDIVVANVKDIDSRYAKRLKEAKEESNEMELE